MPVAQTVQPQENDVHKGGHGFARAIEAIEQTPPETEGFLSREQVVNDLLETLAKEEAVWQKRLSDGGKLSIIAVTGLLAVCAVRLFLQHFPQHFASPQTLNAVNKASYAACLVFSYLVFYSMAKVSGCSVLDLFAFMIGTKERQTHAPYVSQIQQDSITALLNFADIPRVAEALCRAIPYYSGDRDTFYLRLARLLPLLPNDPAFLSDTARRILLNVLRGHTTGLLGIDKQQTLPVLQAAAKAYFDRTSEPAPRPKRKWFKRQPVAPRNAKETG